VDMVMVPFDHQRFMAALEAAVERGAVSEARIDDAVRRILATKARLGLFDATGDPQHEPPLDAVGHPDHRRIAFEAARRSPVLLQNRGDALPLPTTLPALLVAGAADDVGLQCGGWTISWMGDAGPITPGTTLLEGLREKLPATKFTFEPDGDGTERAPVGIVAVAEAPYAEGMGDRNDLDLPATDHALIERVRARVDTLVLVVYSGRPIVLGDAVRHADAIVAAWLPGSEGAAVAEPLVGASPFEATLSYRWPTASADLPLHPFGTEPGPAAQWELGHGLRTHPWPDAKVPA
ncbi:MAG: glycoside hydrolase family 3 protein, partial [Trueperaceae bacterium]